MGKNVELTFSNNQLAHAESILTSLDPDRFKEFDYYSATIFDEKFNNDFDGNKIRKSKYDNCEFNEVNFNGTSGEFSTMTDCRFIACTFINSRFDNSDFSKSIFKESVQLNSICSCGFSNVNFTGSIIEKTNIEGTNFIKSLFVKTMIYDVFFVCCNFTGSNFNSCEIRNCDFSKASLEYVEFNDCVMENSIFQIFSILHSFNGIQHIKKYENKVYLKFPDSKKMLTGTEFINILPEIEAYFFYKKDFFALANIYVFYENKETAFKYILLGINDSFKNKDFTQIKHLCKLASHYGFFSINELNNLFSVLQNNDVIKQLNDFEYNNYLLEMNEIKSILLDNPYGLPQMKISIETDIDYNDIKNVSEIIKYINKAYDIVSKNSPTHLTIRHNSPDIFEFFLNNSEELLNNTFIIMSVLLLGVTTETVKLVEHFHSIKLKKLDEYLTRLKISKLESEMLGLKPKDNLNNDIAATKPQGIAPKDTKRHIKRIKCTINITKNGKSNSVDFELTNENSKE